LVVAATKPYFTASTDLTRALLHIFKEIKKKLIAEPVDMILFVAESEDENVNSNDNNNDNEDTRKNNKEHPSCENEMDIDHEDDNLNLVSEDGQGNYSFQKYDLFKVKNELIHPEEACAGYVKDLGKILKSLPDYSS